MIQHSVCRWCFSTMSLEELCAAAVSLGIDSVELLKPEDAATLEPYGLRCALFAEPRATLANGQEVGGIEHAWNRIEHHDALVEAYRVYLPRVAEVGGTNVICFSGNRAGLDDATGLANCAAGIRRLMPTAEKLGVHLTLELLNSKVDHVDYMADRTAWGVELCEAVGSPNFGLLYDIYHMQVMEGDLIATIRKHHHHFKHIHTAGVPGRHELSADQEINYPAIAAALSDVGYTGHVGHEFLPTGDPIEGLRAAVRVCS